MGAVPRRRLWGLPLGLALLAVAAWLGASALAMGRRAQEYRVAQAAGQLGSSLDSALTEVLDAVQAEARRATGLAPLRAALEHEVDAATFRDLLVSEEWWAPLRERLVVVLSPDGRLVDSGPGAQALLDPALVAPARRRQPARGWVAAGEGAAVAVAAAVPVTGAGRRADAVHVLVLGRPLDLPLLEPLARRLGLSLLVSDGRAAGLYAGEPEGKATLAALVGREGESLRLDPLGRWLAVPVALRPGRWLWALRAQQEQVAWPTWLAPGLLGLATVSGLGALVSWLRRPRPRARGGAGLDLPSTGTPLPPTAEARGPAGADSPTQILDGQAQVFGRYTLLERIGEGGMSELFTAVLPGAEGFRRLYVIKLLKPHIAQNKEAVDQFIDEAKLGSLLVHSNIVPVFDFGKVGSGYFLAQEYISGRNLVQLVERHIERLGEALPPRLVFYIAHEVLDALSYAHARTSDEGQWLNIVHRDVSSGNIMVTAQGEVKLFDFGIVTASERVSSTEIGRVKGNAAYMSPEQARGQPVDARSDLFSLGMVMFTAATGQCLYGTYNPASAFYEATSGLNADQRERVRALPAPLPTILEKALALDPASRYGSARDFADAIAPFVTGVKPEMATLMNALFGEDLRRQNANFRAKLASLPASVRNGS
jgi:hypothetical protein